MDTDHRPEETDAAPGGAAATADPGNAVAAIRLFRVEALRRRAATVGGEARRLLDARLATLRHGHDAPPAARAPVASTPPARGALAGLVECLEARRSASGSAGVAPPVGTGASAHELDAVHELRRIWTRVRTGSQLRRSLASAPVDAGPLNSASLVHRALGLMQDTAPGYLEHFMAYVDALACLERMKDPGAGGDAGGRRRGPRAKPHG